MITGKGDERRLGNFDAPVNWRRIINAFFVGGAFEGIEDHESPFGYKKGEGIDAGSGEVDWICSRDRPRTDPMFENLNPIDGKISGAGKKTTIFNLRLG